MAFETWLMAGILIAMFALLIDGRLPTWLVFMGALTVSITLRLAPEAKLLSGFANQGVVTVGVLFVVAAGMYSTGAITLIADKIIGLPETLRSAQIRILPPVAVGSAFLNNTPLVAMMIPVIRDITRITGLDRSKLFIPLSFASILGGAATLIGTSVNLILAGLYYDATGERLNIFFPTLIGLPAGIVGLAFIMIVGKALLPTPSKRSEEDITKRSYRAEFVVRGPHLVGKTVHMAGLWQTQGYRLSSLCRADGTYPELSADLELAEGDHLVFIALADAVAPLWTVIGLEPLVGAVPMDTERYTHRLVEVAVSAGAPQVGHLISELPVHRQPYEVRLVAISKQGTAPDMPMPNVRIEVGDTAILEVNDHFFFDNRLEQDFTIIKRLRGYRIQRLERAGIAAGITLAMVALAAAGVMSMLNAALLAALAMLLTGCLSARRALRSIEFDTLVVLGAAVGLEAAVTGSGLSAAIGNGLARLGAASPIIAMAAVFFGSVIMTNVITNAAAAAFMFPVAMAMAKQMGVSPEPFIAILMLGTSYAFINPAGYQTNLMVQKPGGYEFSDYVKLGVPLTILVGLVAIGLAPFLYGF